MKIRQRKVDDGSFSNKILLITQKMNATKIDKHHEVSHPSVDFPAELAIKQGERKVVCCQKLHDFFKILLTRI